MNSYMKYSIMYLAITTIALIYAPQPIQGALMTSLHISSYQASIIVGTTLLPMAFAPIIYGYILENANAKTVLIFSLSIVIIIQIVQIFLTNYYVFVVFRFIQALFFPAIQTSLLAMLTRLEASEKDMGKNVGIYVTSTIAGGLIGRILSSVFTDIWNWEIAFLILGVLLIIGLILSFKLPSFKSQGPKIKPKEVLPFLADMRYMWILIGTFGMFFVFQGTLTLIPFVAEHGPSKVTQAQISLLYLGYVVGMIVSFYSSNIVRLFRGRAKAVMFGFVIMIISVAMMFNSNFYNLIAAMVLVCIGGFIIHSVLSSTINTLGSNKRAVVNGLYLTFYYTGGFIGSIIPTFIYESYSFGAVSILFFILLALNLISFAFRIKMYR
ncbi:MFS transporter [Helicobacter sp. 13S00401-1]|uniref:MFS transporter n=1 Tax=Helicobacter sp. 13S00401-1 TaxID=1905758 RepID=UPI000BA518EC|nr:MFS transporter [Helicobacter sp. 13S00401-1]